MSGDRPLRVLGAALALGSAVVHFVLSSANLIPGETTATPAFVLMGLGFTGCAAALLFTRERELVAIALVYAVTIVLAYVGTRGTLPVEAFGLGALAAELGLAAVAARLLARRCSR